MKPTLLNKKTGQKLTRLKISFLVGLTDIEKAVCRELYFERTIKNKAQIIKALKFMLYDEGNSGFNSDFTTEEHDAEKARPYIEKYFPGFLD